MEPNIPIPQQDYKVVINCFTYNQEDFIEDALKGFVRQKTNFPFCAVVVDDCSTDGNTKIIKQYEREYPDIIKVIYLKENYFSQHKKKAPLIQSWNDRCQYVAICEGDDYWIDDYKLQRQVDFLDSHPEYMLHFHNAIVRYQNHNRSDHLISQFISGDFTTTSIFEKWQLPLASVLFRKEVYDSPIYKNLTKNFGGGFCTFIAASKLGKVYGLSECLSVYRKNDGGITNKMSMAYCLQLELDFATKCNDKRALNVMKEKATNIMLSYMFAYLRGKKQAIDIKNVIDDVDRKIFYLALIKFMVQWPMMIMAKIFKEKK